MVNKHLEPLLLYLGNPIIKNDCIGIKIGKRLENDLGSFTYIKLCEFIGSPLDLVAYFAQYKRVILLDSVMTGSLDIGSVVTLKDEEILNYSKSFYYLHGINLPEAVALNKRLGIPLPSQILFIGIEIDRADEFGEILSDELNNQLEDIYQKVFIIVSSFLTEKNIPGSIK